MAGPNVGFATLSIIPSMRGAQAAMAGQIAGPSAAVGQQAGRTMGGSMAGALGSALKVGLGGALVGIGAIAGLAKLGGSFDEAFDTIRVGTGATGDALDDLKDSFKTVFSSVPTDMGTAATAIADLNTRLGLTGEPLEKLSEQLIELSRITDTDLGSNIESVTRVFGDWGISAEDQAGSLDALFRASQATGITVDTLGQQMVKYGAPLRQMGIDFETTAGLLGKFEKEGVNAELVMGSMRIALGKFARDGRDPAEALQWVTEEIQNAGSAGEANALALEVFGARAGPDMAAAIREGRFDLGELYDTISTGNETVLGAAEDTQSFGEKWQIIKNRVLTGLEPIATRVFDAMGRGLDLVSAWWDENGDTVAAGFNTVRDALAEVVSAGLEALSGWWDRNGESVLGFFSEVGRIIREDVIPFLADFARVLYEEVLVRLGQFAKWIADEQWRLELLGTIVGVVLVGHFTALAVAAVKAAVASIVAWGAAALPFVIVAGVVYALGKAMEWVIHQRWFNDLLQWIIDATAWAWRFVEALGAANAQLGAMIDLAKRALRAAFAVLDQFGLAPSEAKGTPQEIIEGKRAHGGPVWPGTWLVGENGPELLTIGQRGHVTPLQPSFDRGSGGGMVQEIHIYREPDEPIESSILRAGRRAAAMAG